MKNIAYRITAQKDAPEGEGKPVRVVSTSEWAITAYFIALERLLLGADAVTIERILFFKASAHTMRIFYVDTREIQA